MQSRHPREQRARLLSTNLSLHANTSPYPRVRCRVEPCEVRRMHTYKYAYIMAGMCSKVRRNFKNIWDLNCIYIVLANCITAVANSRTTVANICLITIINNSYHIFCVTVIAAFPTSKSSLLLALITSFHLSGITLNTQYRKHTHICTKRCLEQCFH